jgi:hypothetical protein
VNPLQPLSTNGAQGPVDAKFQNTLNDTIARIEREANEADAKNKDSPGEKEKDANGKVRGCGFAGFVFAFGMLVSLSCCLCWMLERVAPYSSFRNILDLAPPCAICVRHISACVQLSCFLFFSLFTRSLSPADTICVTSPKFSAELPTRRCKPMGANLWEQVNYEITQSLKSWERVLLGEYISSFIYPSHLDSFHFISSHAHLPHSEVHKATHIVSKHVVALKRILMHNEKEGVPVTALREIKILKMLSHPSVVTVCDMVVEAGASTLECTCIVPELMGDGWCSDARSKGLDLYGVPVYGP